jgi:hypothetical protein
VEVVAAAEEILHALEIVVVILHAPWVTLRDDHDNDDAWARLDDTLGRHRAVA